jgi:hypothetical protein
MHDEQLGLSNYGDGKRMGECQLTGPAAANNAVQPTRPRHRLDFPQIPFTPLDGSPCHWTKVQ